MSAGASKGGVFPPFFCLGGFYRGRARKVPGGSAASVKNYPEALVFLGVLKLFFPPKEAPAEQALGRAWGGFGAKIHVAVDALGNPPRISLTGGQVDDLR